MQSQPPKCGIKNLEQLFHFSCGACKKWWSVADAPEEKVEWFCPWCGEKQMYNTET